MARSLPDIYQALVEAVGPVALSGPWSEVLSRAEERGERALLVGLSRDPRRSIDTVLRDAKADARYRRHDRFDRQAIHIVLRRWSDNRDDGWVPPLPPASAPPPTSWAALRAWIKEHDLEPILQNPRGSLRPFTFVGMPARTMYEVSREASLEDLFDPESRARRDSGKALLEILRGYLAYALGRRQKMERRRILWARPPATPQLGELAVALHALRSRHADAEPPAPIFAENARVRVDPDEGVLHALIPTRWGQAELSIHLLERDGDVTPARFADSHALHGRQRHAWPLALAEWALDAIHDEAHPLHAPLAEAAGQPRWTRLLKELDTKVVAPEATPERARERVVWRVGVEGGELTMEAAVQKKGKRGWTKGRRVVPVDLPRGRELDTLDQCVVDALLRDPNGGFVELIGHPRVVLRDAPDRGVRVRDASLGVELVGSPLRRLFIRMGSERLTPAETRDHLVSRSCLAVLDRAAGELRVGTIAPALQSVIEAAARWQTDLPREADEALMSILFRLPSSVGLRVPDELSGRRVPPDLRPHVLLTVEVGGALQAELRVHPLGDERRFTPGGGPAHLLAVVDGERRSTSRDLDAEVRAAEAWTDRLGLSSAREIAPHRFLLQELDDALDLLATLQGLGEDLVVEWPTEERLRLRQGSGQFRASVKAAEEWFVLDASMQIDEVKVGLAQLMRAHRANARYVQIGPGEFARISEQMAGQLDALSDLTNPEADELAIRPEAALGVAEALGETLATNRAWDSMLARIERANDANPRTPRGLSAELRGYQRDGVIWLSRLAEWASGACLADEMGLGKTLMALALLLRRKKAGPALVIAPTSLAYNWRDEAARFAPELEVVIYRGPGRSAALEGARAGQVFVTSYELMARDVEALEAISWGTVVYDEAHALKNPKTRRAKAARRLRAGFRLGLTGTPLENHLGELWSLYSILVPGLLGPFPRFKRRFGDPIEREGDAERRDALRRMISPFLLRRTKSKVLAELPPRTEVVQPVELSADEIALYETERRAALEDLLDKGADPKSRFAVLAALTRLRRLACHPALVHPESHVASSKLDSFLELVDELQEEGRRALVFSQFTSHLALVRSALRERGIEPPYLDGQTSVAERARLVERFQRGDDLLFLVSLKAGGTGLNLTAADTVIHLDPWWNPAAEDQASDRAHRIGQERPVTVVRLIAQGTIEEQVLALHEEKRELARGVLEGAETNARIDTKQLMALLRAGPEA